MRLLSLCCAANSVASLFILSTESTDNFVSSKCHLAFCILWVFWFCGPPLAFCGLGGKIRKPKASWQRLHKALASPCITKMAREHLIIWVIFRAREMLISCYGCPEGGPIVEMTVGCDVAEGVLTRSRTQLLPNNCFLNQILRESVLPFNPA